MVLENIIVVMLGFAVMFAFQTLIYRMLLEAEATAENYRGEKIPVGLGIAYVLSLVTAVMLANLYFKQDFKIVYSLILGVLSMGFVGLMDDLLGDKGTKGFKGHIKSLLGGKLTTGGLKAISGFGIGFLISISISDGIIELGVNTLLVALFTNVINLFDLRPGRACKVFLFLGVVTLLTSAFSIYGFMMLSAIGVVLAYIGYDLSAKSMLGDVGSNAMGITLGVFSVATSPMNVKFVYLGILIALHLISEFYSFTKIIESNKLLKTIDKFGRR